MSSFEAASYRARAFFSFFPILAELFKYALGLARLGIPRLRKERADCLQEGMVMGNSPLTFEVVSKEKLVLWSRSRSGFVAKAYVTGYIDASTQ